LKPGLHERPALAFVALVALSACEKAQPVDAPIAREEPGAVLQRACDSGDPDACFALGIRYRLGDGLKPDEARASELVRRAAELRAHETPAIPLEAPAPTGKSEVRAVFSIVLAADGRTLVDGTLVSNDDAILPLAKQAHADAVDVRAVIKADAAVSHGRVIHVLDLLKQAGVAKIAFGVTPVPPAPTGGP
jgi:biopolymer transport protein ExbD